VARRGLRPDRPPPKGCEEPTERPTGACAAGNQTYMTPLGFATENFDALGRHRTAERLFDEDGNQVAEKAVDTHTIPRVQLQDTETTSSGAGDLTDQLLTSGLVQSCFARQYFRFTMGRAEDVMRDGCTLEVMRQQIMDGEPLKNVLMTVAQRPEFKQRTFTP